MQEQQIEKADLVHVFTNGGMVSPNQLKKILQAAKAAGVDYIHFGSRQDILFPCLKKSQELEALLEEINLSHDTIYQGRQNIMSSYVSSGITSSTSWIHSDTYHYILEDFDYQPRLKINLVDPAQMLVPLFTGELNFIASPIDNYWYLSLKFREGEEPQFCSSLIYSSQIADVCLFAEETLQAELSHKELAALINKRFELKATKETLRITENLFPYYEGFHKMTAGQHWLGLYWRNNQYDIPFLEAMCDLCAETHVGKIGITPWKSFIVKGIKDSQLIQWEKLLGKYGINTRHSSLELYWHTPVLDAEAMELKRFLVRTFDQNDINTSGLSFTIKTRPMVTFSSIIIEKNPVSSYAEKYDLFESYNIYHTRKFNPNAQEKMLYARNVLREDLPAMLIQLSRHYYDQLKMEREEVPQKKEHTNDGQVKVHQCKDCFTIYDARFGDTLNGVAAGTLFNALPESYACQVCGSGKESFQEVTVFADSYQVVEQ